MVRIVGVDYGRRRVGLAVCDEDAMMAFPKGQLDVRDPRDAVVQTAAACKRLEATRVVVGMPVNMDGSRGPMAQEVTVFVEALRKRTGLEVETWDERLTTSGAERMLIAMDVSREKRKGLRDQVAAQQLLQSYLDAKGAGPGP